MIEESVQECPVQAARLLHFVPRPANQKYRPHTKHWLRYEKPQPGHRLQLDVKFLEEAEAGQERLQAVLGGLERHAGGVAPVVLDPVAGFLRDERGGNEQAVEAARSEAAVQPVPARARLVGKYQPGRVGMQADVHKDSIAVAYARKYGADPPVFVGVIGT